MSRQAISRSGIAVVLLACVFFLQRFTWPLGQTELSFSLPAVTLVLLYQFLAGRAVISYDRLAWFLALSAVATCSLLANFGPAKLTSYGEFIVLYSFFLLRRSSAGARPGDPLQAFQLLALLFATIGIAQFLAQFFISGRELTRFYGIIPDFVISQQVNSIQPIRQGSALIKSNGIFLAEPSTLSQVTALAIIIEIAQFGRLAYLIVLTLGLLFAYSGTGLILILIFLPLAAVGRARARLPALLVALLAAGLLATGAIDLSVFTERTREFHETNASGFARFVSPLWEARTFLEQGSASALLFGSGPGTFEEFTERLWFAGQGSGGVTWFKLFYEYGLMGAAAFTCFLASSLRGSRCSRLIVAAVLFMYCFLGGQLLDPASVVIIIVFCTLNRIQPQRKPHRSGAPSAASGDPAQTSYGRARL
jgi:hypothetical protein